MVMKVPAGLGALKPTALRDETKPNPALSALSRLETLTEMGEEPPRVLPTVSKSQARSGLGHFKATSTLKTTGEVIDTPLVEVPQEDVVDPLRIAATEPRAIEALYKAADAQCAPFVDHSKDVVIEKLRATILAMQSRTISTSNALAAGYRGMDPAPMKMYGTPFEQDTARKAGTGWREKMAELDKLESDYAGEQLMDLMGGRRVPPKWSSMRKDARIEWLEEHCPMVTPR